MIRGRRIEVRYHGHNYSALNNMIQLSWDFRGLCLYYEEYGKQEGPMQIEYYEGKKKLKSVPECSSYTTLKWKLIEILEGKTCQKPLKTVLKGEAQLRLYQDQTKAKVLAKTNIEESATSTAKRSTVTSKQKKASEVKRETGTKRATRSTGGDNKSM